MVIVVMVNRYVGLEVCSKGFMSLLFRFIVCVIVYI